MVVGLCHPISSHSTICVSVQFFDNYTLRARVLPALITILPLGLVIFALLPKYPLFVTALFGLVSAGGTVIVAQAGRALGRRKERKLWESWGGPPTTRLLRHHRGPEDIAPVPGLRQQVEGRVDYPLPTEQEELDNPSQADAKYEEAVAFLRGATRNQVDFPLVFAENVNYGFRRNLWGLRPVGLPIAVGFALSFWALLVLTIWGRPWPDPWWDVLVNPDDTVVIRLVVAIVDTAFAVFWLFYVKPSWIKVAAETYAERLMESVQTLQVDQLRIDQRVK